jgi:HK97 family phage portal protein
MKLPGFISKAFSMVFGSGTSGSVVWFNDDVPIPEIRRVADKPWTDPVVSICLSWIADNFAEPEHQVTRKGKDGRPVVVPDHPLLSLLDTPNPYYDRDTLWMGTLLSYLLDGNAYWIKVRGDRDEPKELYWAPHWTMAPIGGAKEMISGYEYTVGGVKQRLRREDVVHFRFGFDPEDPKKGFSRLKALDQELYSDKAFSRYAGSLARNFGVPGVVMAPKDPKITLRKEQRDELKTLWREEATGEKIGGVLVLSGSVDVQKIAYSPAELAIDGMRKYPEARICAALRVSPLVVDLPVGLERSTYSNKEEARRGAYYDCLIPIGVRFARTVNRHLMMDVSSDTSDRFGFDYSAVRALREDENKLYTRVALGYRSGVLKRKDARRMVGQDVDETADDVYYTDVAGATFGGGNAPRIASLRDRRIERERAH